MSKWWEGMNFSIGAKVKRQELEEDLVAAVDFISNVSDSEDIEQEHKELHLRMEKYLDDEDKLVEEDSERIENFLNYWNSLNDDRSLNEMFEDAIQTKCYLFNSGGEYEMMKYYPERYGKKLSKQGSWIMIVRLPGVSTAMQPELFGVYYAKPVPLKTSITISEFARERTKTYDYYKVKIQTTTTELHLWPHEYVVVADINEVLSGVGTEFEMVKLGGDTNYDTAKVHYLGTRGIPQFEVYNMLLGNINSINFAYFRLTSTELIEYYQFFFNCMEKGIRAEMVPRLYESMKTGKPLFKLKYMKEGKEVTEDEFNTGRSKDREEENPVKDQAES